jgi:hypothetical protein
MRWRRRAALRAFADDVPYDRRVAALFLVVGVVTAGLAAYYYVVFLGLEDPLTHAMPSSVDYFSYVRYYYQTETDYQLLWKLSAVALGISLLSLLSRSISDLPVFRPLHTVHAFLRSRPQSFKTVTLTIPLVLLEAGLLLYGGLMGVASSAFSLSLEIREDPLVRALLFGPLGSSGGSYGTGQDYYFLVLYLAVLASSFYRFGSVRRTLQVGTLAIIPLPTLIYLFDRIEFNTFFASVLARSGLPWFSNAVLLYLSVGVLVLTTAYPLIRRVATKVVRHATVP